MHYRKTPTNIMCVALIKILFIYPARFIWRAIKGIYYALKYKDDEEGYYNVYYEETEESEKT